MKKNVIKIIMVFIILGVAGSQASESDSWYDRAANYANKQIKNMTTDDITFEEFYKEDSSVGWIGTAAGAIIVTAVIVYTGGTAAPALAGTAHSGFGAIASIGSLFAGEGLVGAAAASSGLAFLGGGSMAAGVIMVGSALTFGTTVVVDYAMTEGVDRYSYNNFVSDSKNMMTLPLPKNTKGSISYEKAMDTLEGIENLNSEKSQKMIKKVIQQFQPIEKSIYESALKTRDAMSVSDAWNDHIKFNKANDIVVEYEEDMSLDNDEKAKEEALLALLYFATYDYHQSKEHALTSITLAKEENAEHTLPSYIYATSSLYDTSFDYDELVKELKYAFTKEADNPLIPMLLSIHLDRLMYRYSEGFVVERNLKKVYEAVSDSSLRDLRLQNYIIVLSRYIIALKMNQQKISSLALTDNKTIKNSFKTLDTVKNTLKDYENLLDGQKEISKKLHDLKIETETEKEVLEKINNFDKLIVQYDNDKQRLKGLISDFETYLNDLDKKEIVISDADQEKSSKTIIFIIVGLIILILVTLTFLKKRGLILEKKEDASSSE